MQAQGSGPAHSIQVKLQSSKIISRNYGEIDYGISGQITRPV
ncbi:MAG: hypothetical protein ACRC54_04635 [Fusobacteriaceae bacterium]